MITIRFRRWRRAVAAALIPVVARATEPSVTTTNQLDPVVVEATRIPIAVDQSPTATTILTRDQLDDRQVTTVAEALREEVGIDISRQGQPGGQTSLFLRGANSNQTLVLIDGVRVNSGFNNAYDFANLSLDNVERIEVLHGPQSTLYGSEAMGGVINIVTRRGAVQPTGSVTVEGGTYESLRSRAQFAAPAGPLALAAEGSYLTTANDRINSDLDAWNGSGRVTWDALERLRVSFLGTYLQSEAGSPNDKFTNDPNDYLRNENTLVALTLTADPTDWWNVKLTVSHAHERAYFSGREPNPPFFFGDFTELTVTDRDQIDFQNVFTLGDHHTVLLGGLYDDSSADDVNTFGTLDKTVTDKALYTQYDWIPVERLTLTVGGRLDDYSTFGTHGTYRFGGRFTTPGTATILRASVGSGFRAPSFVQTFPPFGNPALDPEESLGWDAGFEQPLAAGTVRVGATYFQNEFDDLVISVPGPPPFFSILANAGRARTLGVETWARWTPLPVLTLQGTYTWLAEARDLSNDTDLLRRPEHSGRLTVDYRFLERFAANLSGTLVGERADRNFAAGTSVTNAGYVKVDLGLTCDITKHVAVFGRVENLFDDQYEEVYGFPALGRTLWAGGTARF